MASQPLQRNFSFGPNDEEAMRPRQYQQTQRQDYAQQYSNQDTQFSPVEMTSPVERTYNVSPPNLPANPPAVPRHANHPAYTPGSSFQQMQSERQYSVPPSNQAFQQSPPSTLRKPVPAGSLSGFQQRPDAPQYHLPNHPPIPPEYPVIPTLPQPLRRESLTTPGSDNMSDRAAGGGIAGIAFGVANQNERDSGIQALRGIENMERNRVPVVSPYGGPSERHYQERPGYEPPYGPDQRGAASYGLDSRDYDSHSSTSHLMGGSTAPGMASPPRAAMSPPGPNLMSNIAARPPASASPNRRSELYTDDPYSHYGPGPGSRLMPEASFHPDDIADDGDDDFPPQPKRNSLLNMGRSGGSGNNLPAAAAAGAGAGVAAAAAVGGAFSRFGGNRDQSGQYSSLMTPPGAKGGSSGDLSYPTPPEKSAWLEGQKKGNKKMKWIVGGVIVLIVILAIAGGVIGGILANKNKSSSSKAAGGGSSDQTAEQDAASGDLNINSAEIKKLMNNPNLRKVFMGMDYTPLNTQYPDCLVNPPSQNNVTRDMAMLSQLTNVVRLYGTDCNQTEMVLHAIDRLKLKDMKVWLGVWLDTNTTTNARQLSQMWNILDKNGADPFSGVIVGNEILFRLDMTATQLGTVLDGVKKNLTAKGLDLPLATSDLGDAWSNNPGLASYVDVVMSNIHPFFGGIAVGEAASWSWTFWQTHDGPLTAGTTKKQVISEIGWPSEGGQRCTVNGIKSTCPSKTSGSVAGIDEMNTFMNDFVCQALNNGTDYFWFEGFDEPWKVRFNTKEENWEDKWGLMNVNRELKAGLKIPDCGGKRVP